MVDWLAPRPGLRLLDVAGGTGDIAFRVLDRVERRDGPATRIAVCDINPAMLGVGRDRAIDQNRLDPIEWLCGDAEALPFADRSVDAYTIAFGIRNVTRIERALAEARRVLRPGGRFLCLEFSQFRLEALSGLYDQLLVHGGAVARRAGRRRPRRLPVSRREHPALSRPGHLARHDRAGRARPGRYRNLSGRHRRAALGLAISRACCAPSATSGAWPGSARCLARHNALFPLELAPVPEVVVRITRRVSRKDAPGRPGERLAQALQELGPSFIKLGQSLATRADLLGQQLAEDLSRLQDALPAVRCGDARAA